jgi:hypothetical protein
MSRIEIPQGWDQVEEYAKRYGDSESFIDYIETFKTTNEKTVRRVCMADNPAYLPGAFQTLDYTLAIFGKNPRGAEVDMGQAALRAGLWRTYFREKGRLEIVIHPNALTTPPGNLGKTAMRDALSFAHVVAERDDVNLRIREPDTPSAEQAGTWTLKYPYGLDGGVVQPTATMNGIDSLLPIGQSAVRVMEKTWDIIQENALDRDASLRAIHDAAYPPPVPPMV